MSFSVALPMHRIPKYRKFHKESISLMFSKVITKRDRSRRNPSSKPDLPIATVEIVAETKLRHRSRKKSSKIIRENVYSRRTITDLEDFAVCHESWKLLRNFPTLSMFPQWSNKETYHLNVSASRRIPEIQFPIDRGKFRVPLARIFETFFLYPPFIK